MATLEAVRDEPKITLEIPYSVEIKPGSIVFGTFGSLAYTAMRVSRWLHPDIPVFMSGYPGSPTADIISEGENHRSLLREQGIIFSRGNNEEAGVGAAWGTQHIGTLEGDKYPGVFSIVAAKGPGVRRSLDVLNQFRADGPGASGASLFIAGDDHWAASTSVVEKTDGVWDELDMPLLTPSSTVEALEHIIIAQALSNFSGSNAALKVTAPIAEGSATGDVGCLIEVAENIVIPELPPGSVSVSYDPDHSRFDQGALRPIRRDRAQAFVDANLLNQIPKGWEGWKRPSITGGGWAQTATRLNIGIAAPGESYAQVRQALYELGVDEKKAAELGIRLFKIAAPNNISAESAAKFAEGLDEILVVEDLRNLVEGKLRNALYGNLHQPRIVGRKDEHGNALLREKAHTTAEVALAVAERILKAGDIELDLKLRTDRDVYDRMTYIRDRLQETASPPEIARRPYLCAGCPHRHGIAALDGSINDSPTSCGVMGTHKFTMRLIAASTNYQPMGTEGSRAVGQSYFNNTHHVAQMGDGTYWHSGRQAIWNAMYAYRTQEAPVKLTYKILANGTTAMTGGQDTGGSVADMVRDLAGIGVTQIVVATEGDARYRRELRREIGQYIPEGVLKIIDRAGMGDEMGRLRTDLEKEPGINVLIHDSRCRTEIRRDWARGVTERPEHHVIINKEVCEGCSHCSITTDCIGLELKPAELNDVMEINDTTCNLSLDCVKEGFCPSFVIVPGKSRKFYSEIRDLLRDQGFELQEEIPDAQPAAVGDHHATLTTGIGGQGATLVGSILGGAATLQNLMIKTFNQAGLAQKGGPVTNIHLVGTEKSKGMHAVTLSTGKDSCADVILACDPVTAGHANNLSLIGPKTVVIMNTGIQPVGQAQEQEKFRHKNDVVENRLNVAITQAGSGHYAFNASAVSRAVTGSEMATNMVMLGFACQHGLLPHTVESVMQAIRIYGRETEANLRAFEWGRRCAVQPGLAEKLQEIVNPKEPLLTNLQDKIDYRAGILAQFQNAALALRYREIIEQVRQMDHQLGRAEEELSEAVAIGLFRAWRSKDEFEVARLHMTDKARADQHRRVARNEKPMSYSLSPPVISKFLQGRKMEISQGKAHLVFNILKRMKGIWNWPVNPFRWTKEGRTTNEIKANYDSFLSDLLKNGIGNDNNYDAVVKQALVPELIKGFGHVRDEALANNPILPFVVRDHKSAPVLVPAA